MIVSAGEALIDLVPVTTDAGLALRPVVGGSPLNVAIGLARLGVKAGFLGAVSTDAFGERIGAALAESGVDLGLLSRVFRPTPLAIATLTDGLAGYSFYDTGTAARGMTPRELKALPPEATILHFGSIAIAADPAAATLIACVEAARSGRLISLDPNVRGAFARKGTYRNNIERALRLADILKVSTDDMAWLRPRHSAEAFAAHRLAAGNALVVVTRGAEGAIGFTRQATCEVAAPSVEVVDTIGAGDAFTAGLLAALHEGGIRSRDDLAALRSGELANALRFAAAVAAVTCTRAGADPPWRRELAP